VRGANAGSLGRERTGIKARWPLGPCALIFKPAMLAQASSSCRRHTEPARNWPAGARDRATPQLA